MSGDGLNGGLWAAELAALPLLDLMTSDVDWTAAGEGGNGWEQLASLERVEIYQATGKPCGRMPRRCVERRLTDQSRPESRSSECCSPRRRRVGAADPAVVRGSCSAVGSLRLPVRTC
jgi:hypothetical protein